MYGRTHIVVGAASSLAILHPITTTGMITAIVGGAFGGWICDIDLARGKHHDIPWLFLLIVIPLAIDYKVGVGICDYIASNWNNIAIIGVVLFLTVCLCAILFMNHKTFTHSFLGAVVFALALYLFCKPLVPAFIIGLCSHLIMDFFTENGMMLFFPIKTRISLDVCETGGVIDTCLFILSVIATVFMIGCFWVTGHIFFA